MRPKHAQSLWGRLWSGLFVNHADCRELAALLGKHLCMKHGCSSPGSWSEIKSELNL